MAATSHRKTPARTGMLVLLALLAPAPAAAQQAQWLRGARATPAEARAYLANGRFSIQGSPRGTTPTLSLLAGFYEQADGDIPRIAGLPSWNEIDVDIGAGWLNARPTGRIGMSNYTQTLDLRRAVLETRYRWTVGRRSADLRVRTFVSRADSAIAVVELDVTPRQDGRITVRFPLRARTAPRRMPLAIMEELPAGTSNRPTWYPGHVQPLRREAEPHSGGGRVLLTGVADGSPVLIAEAAVVRWSTPLRQPSSQPRITDDGAAIELRFQGTRGRTYRFRKYVAVANTTLDADTAGIADAALAAAEAAAAAGTDSLLAAHARAWAELWRTDIVITGNAELQRVARSMLYHLLASVREGQEHSLPPMGLSSGGYYGHVFWDADTWMFPPLLLLQPELARSVVLFRSRTLGAAMENARRNGFRGAMYPWEAGGDGEETTPRFAWQNALQEIHINGDVALAQWQYFQATGQTDFLAAHAYPVLRATAEFWMSRVKQDADGRYVIPGVVSVAEDEIGVANETYTNAIARMNLELAAKAATLLGLVPDPNWLDVAQRIVIPYDSALDFHPTYEGAPAETRGSVVTLLSYPLQLPMSDTAKRNNLRYAVEHMRVRGRGAMMTTTLYAVLAAELGDRALFNELVPLSWKGFVHPPFDILSETPDNDAYNFITGAGGFLQQVVFGWTGLRLTDAGLEPVHAPMLPQGVRRLELRNLKVRGERLNVIVEGDALRFVREP